MIGLLRRETTSLVRAWHLTEGDQAFGGETVVALYRDALRHTITVVWDTGGRAQLSGDRWVELAYRPFAPDANPITLRHRVADVASIPSGPMTPRDRATATGASDHIRAPLEHR